MPQPNLRRQSRQPFRRVTVALPPSLYAMLEEAAQDQGVSMSLLGREAVEAYIEAHGLHRVKPKPRTAAQRALEE